MLVAPQTAGNVGSAARAIKNFGFSRLTLVAPDCEPSDEQARRLAADARDVLASAEIHATLDEALADARSVVGTTRRTGKYRKPHWRLDEFRDEWPRLVAAGETAIVFGREDSGLTDEELDRCTHLVEIPTEPLYPSANLAQAVMLLSYELQLAAGLAERPQLDEIPAATHAEREAMYAHLEQSLRAIGFLNTDGAEAMMRRLRRLFGRAELSGEEATILRGLARQILWAAERIE